MPGTNCIPRGMRVDHHEHCLHSERLHEVSCFNVRGPDIKVHYKDLFMIEGEKFLHGLRYKSWLFRSQIACFPLYTIHLAHLFYVESLLNKALYLILSIHLRTSSAGLLAPHAAASHHFNGCGCLPCYHRFDQSHQPSQTK